MAKKWIGGSVAVILLLVLGAWCLGWFEPAEDPLITKMREIAAAPPEQRNDPAIRNEFQTRMQGMTEEQRAALFEKMAPIFVPMMMRFTADYDKFMAMTPEERNKELDKRIDEMVARGGPGGPGGQGGPGGPGGGRGGPRNVDPKKMAEFQKKMLAYTTPDQRAKMDNGMQLFFGRMKERGITPPPMPGGGFF